MAENFETDFKRACATIADNIATAREKSVGGYVTPWRELISAELALEVRPLIDTLTFYAMFFADRSQTSRLIVEDRGDKARLAIERFLFGSEKMTKSAETGGTKIKMGYEYRNEREALFTEAGQRRFIAVRDKVKSMIKTAGAFRLGEAGIYSWEEMACVDRMVELGELVEFKRESWGQYRVFTTPEVTNR